MKNIQDLEGDLRFVERNLERALSHLKELESSQGPSVRKLIEPKLNEIDKLRGQRDLLSMHLRKAQVT